MRVLHVINTLNRGGAETMLVKLVGALPSVDAHVATLRLEGPLISPLKGLGIPLTDLGLRRGMDGLQAARAFRRLLKSTRPTLVQTWLYASDLFGGICATFTGIPTVWNVRATRLHQDTKASALATVRAAALVSAYIPAAIIVNSRAGADFHIKLGYDARRIVVIPNGFDTARFKPDPDARKSLRRSLGLDDSHRVVGLVARFDPHKDHTTFLRAAARLAPVMPQARFLLCGRDITHNSWLERQLASSGILDRAILLDEQPQVERVFAALDLATLTSMSEGFPNVIGEAMACGVPCVATDVGDCGAIISDTGVVVPAADPRALASAWESLLREPISAQALRGVAARTRIIEHYSLDAIAQQYRHLWESVASRRHGQPLVAPPR